MDDGENTNQHPPIRCRLGFHKWGKWGEKFKIPDTLYAFEYQQRKCLLCGIIGERKI
jgi:hypothetical protein